MFSSIPGTRYPLDARGTLPVVKTKKVPQHGQIAPGMGSVSLAPHAPPRPLRAAAVGKDSPWVIRCSFSGVNFFSKCRLIFGYHCLLSSQPVLSAQLYDYILANSSIFNLKL